jgi:hypothetical protein
MDKKLHIYLATTAKRALVNDANAEGVMRMFARVTGDIEF